MIRAGFRVDWEPYLKSVLLAIRAHLLGVRAHACAPRGLIRLRPCLPAHARCCRYRWSDQGKRRPSCHARPLRK
jgi:hypothetical protein